MYRNRIAILAVGAVIAAGSTSTLAQGQEQPTTASPMTTARLKLEVKDLAEFYANSISATPAKRRNWRVLGCKQTSTDQGYCNATWSSKSAACRGQIVVWKDPEDPDGVLYYARNMRCRART